MSRTLKLKDSITGAEVIAVVRIVITTFAPSIAFHSVVTVCGLVTCGNSGISWNLSINQLCEESISFWSHILLRVYFPSGACCLPNSCAIKVLQKDHDKLWWQSSELHTQRRARWATRPRCHNATGKVPCTQLFAWPAGGGNLPSAHSMNVNMRQS